MTSGLEDGLEQGRKSAAKRQTERNSTFGNEMDEWPIPGS